MRQGTQIGHYEVLALIGKGGMGEVWKARDAKLHREVAIKVIPDEFVKDGDRLSRFEREARLLASLNHPHIATIHGLEESGNTRFLVLELIDGETLADRLRSGPIPEVETLQIALQIAQALEAAHEKGVIHRDLKPANVKINSEGRVKVLDFGLAKIQETNPDSQSLSNSPTLSALQTAAGLILGTAAYMSPEQARGKNVDRRADVWAFGCVLYEMLTGRQTFLNEETVSDTIAAILKAEPDWKALPQRTSPRIRMLLERCLRKDPRRRLPDIGAARLEIEEALNTPEPSMPMPATRSHMRYLVVVSVTALLLASLVAGWVLTRPEPKARIARFDLFIPGLILVNPNGQTLSPDGAKLAIVAGPQGGRRIWIRPLDSTAAQPLAGTDGAERVAWSANSDHLAFFAQGKLKRIPVNGGPPVVLAELPGRDIAWSSHDVILIGGQGKGLLQISASGGPLVPVTELSEKELTHDYPEFLPDGRHFLYMARSGSTPDDWVVYASELGSKERHALPGIHSAPKYSPTGHIIFNRGTTLMAQSFDVDRLELRGEPFLIGDDTYGEVTALASISNDGTLAYGRRVSGGESQPSWFDRTGKPLGVAAPAGDYSDIELSPNGKYLAFHRRVDQNVDVYVLDMERGLISRFTSHPAADASPKWSPDSRAIAFLSSRDPAGNAGPQNLAAGHLYKRAFGMVGEDIPLLKIGAGKTPTDWSRNGRYLAYSSQADIWALPLQDDSKPLRLTNTPFVEGNARISPDGRWIAYNSTESGINEVYVQSFPQPGTRQQVSSKGGALPRWSLDGTELFYLSLYPDSDVMAVSIKSAGSELNIGPPVRLFSTRLPSSFDARSFNVSAKGFLMNVSTSEEKDAPYTIILNWAAGLKK